MPSGRPRRVKNSVQDEVLLPPPTVLEPHHAIAQAIKATGNNLYQVSMPSGQSILVELPARFRNTIWIKRGTFVVVDTSAFADRDNKIGGEIVNVAVDVKAWRKQAYWPPEFQKKQEAYDESDDEESTVGKLPPSHEDSEVEA